MGTKSCSDSSRKFPRWTASPASPFAMTSPTRAVSTARSGSRGSRAGRCSSEARGRKRRVKPIKRYPSGCCTAPAAWASPSAERSNKRQAVPRLTRMEPSLWTRSSETSRRPSRRVDAGCRQKSLAALPPRSLPLRPLSCGRGSVASRPTRRTCVTSCSCLAPTLRLAEVRLGSGSFANSRRRFASHTHHGRRPTNSRRWPHRRLIFMTTPRDS
mmetsp:Transcript_49875/g.139591  ORF Transcript_49875/g.139591 Transcript_49875/m.139591 type:complete len:214 (-) Transcript_49875:942-1583(-)